MLYHQPKSVNLQAASGDGPIVDALRALAWLLDEPSRAQRLLDLTGLTPQDLRARAQDPVVLAACLDFLAAHEPDLIACAASIGVDPLRLIRAREGLS